MACDGSPPAAAALFGLLGSGLGSLGGVRLMTVDDDSEDSARRRAQSGLEYLRNRGIDATLQPVATDRPASEVICEEAERQRCDLIAMGPHGRSGSRSSAVRTRRGGRQVLCRETRADQELRRSPVTSRSSIGQTRSFHRRRARESGGLRPVLHQSANSPSKRPTSVKRIAPKTGPRRKCASAARERTASCDPADAPRGGLGV